MRRNENQRHYTQTQWNEIVVSCVKRRIVWNTERKIYLFKNQQTARMDRDRIRHVIRISWYSRVYTRQDKAGHRTVKVRDLEPSGQCEQGSATFCGTSCTCLRSTPLSENYFNFVAERNPLAPLSQTETNTFKFSVLWVSNNLTDWVQFLETRTSILPHCFVDSRYPLILRAFRIYETIHWTLHDGSWIVKIDGQNIVMLWSSQ